MKKTFKLNATNAAIKKRLYQSKAYEIADFFDNLGMSDCIRLMGLMDKAKQANVFAYLDQEMAYELLKELPDTTKRNILNNLETDDLKNFLEELETDELSWIIPLLSEKKKLQMKSLLNYKEETAGSIMSLDFLTIPLGLSIPDATTKVIRDMKETDYIDTIFVVNKEQKLFGTLDLKELIVARKNDDINEIINEEYAYALIDEDIDFVIEKVRNYDIKAIPVLDETSALQGIITADDIMLELSESHEEDFNQLAMVNDFDEGDSIPRRAFKRLPWLLISVVLNVFIAMFLSRFEHVMESVLALTFFTPMILGMAGNIGTQSLAATILGLNSKKIIPGEKTKKHIKKELLTAVINSILLGIAAFIIVSGFLFVLELATGKPEQAPILMIGTTVGVSIFVALTGSALMSVFVPLGFSKIKVDPAAASGPIITTFNDVFALLVYFGTASIILINYLSH